MTEEDFKALSFAVLYAMAAIFGLVGGCAVGVQQVMGANKRLAFVLAYAIIGGVSALGFYAATHVWSALHNFRPVSIHELVLYSIVIGGAVSLSVFSANQTVRFIFHRLGIEVQFTLRKAKEERRHEESHKP